jgi:transposase
MREVKEVLRLRLTAGLSNRKIALCTGVGKSAVSKHVARAEELGLDWPRVAAMAEEAVEALLYPPSDEARPGEQVVPDWDEVARELRRKGVTKRLLWEEYQEEQGARSYSYSRYCELFARWKGGIEPVMRFEHAAGELPRWNLKLDGPVSAPSAADWFVVVVSPAKPRMEDGRAW